ncbi:MAG TPA: amidophosphoribosyltransferase [Caldithrix abyssi]|uniref:Amidophosphoribosyltransferase n=1 Tax=Caldithrix abyssi TaxID=187145 RepID=A0A7V4TY77_CALAY|nr:amidophosphoribosyltransferase [Caldithrix abyssi]
MCGIIGVVGYKDISAEIMNGMTTLQHRGQDSAGIVTFNGNFHLHKGMGQVREVFRNIDLKRIDGYCGLGHVRYSTMGSTEAVDAQPIVVNYPYGLAMVHNGNVINFNQLRKTLYEEHHRLLDTSNDVALILYTFASELERKELKNLTVDDIFDTVEAVQKLVKGAYSALTIIANRGFLAFTDPYGIRPLVMGRKYTDQGVVYAFASESSSFDYLGYELMYDLRPGEMVFIDSNHQVHRRIGKTKKQAFCVFEYIYFAREDTVIHNRLVASERVRMGKQLAATFRKSGLQPDIIIDVPNSAYFFASGLAEELGVPYRRGMAKNPHMGRSFITPNQEQRELMVKQKLNPIRDIVKGKKVAVVDDSIVRGTTSKRIVKLLRDAGAKEVYFVSASPPIKHPCIYGIDMSVKKEILASHYEIDEIAKYIGADAVVYQSLDDLKEMYKDLPICHACFSGNYPTGITKELLKEIEQEKLGSNRV